MRRLICFFPLIACLLRICAQDVPYPDGAVEVVRPIVHDPVILEQDGVYYMFHTGPGITSWRSHDRVHWDTIDPVFPTLPAWMHATIDGFTGHIWAPDISYHNGKYYLYYSVSAFGRNTSCIGLATNDTLNPDEENYQWVDHGIVIRSYPGLNDWNAIDPNLVVTQGGEAYLSFGSFWGGLFIAQLNGELTGLAEDWEHLACIATRNPSSEPRPEQGYPIEPGDGAIEAPFIVEHDDYYYLFASIDYCCRGAASNYKMIVGRARDVRGPYVDSSGVSLLEGGGDILLTGDDNWYGVGHCGISELDGRGYLVYHGYDVTDPAGRARLLLRTIRWTWPITLGQEE